MRRGLALLVLLQGPVASAQPPWAPDRVVAIEAPTDVHDPAFDAALDAEVAAALARLDPAATRAAAKVPQALRWPLALQPGPGIDWHAVSNFVDLDLAFPGRVRDFNCGTRSYDTAQGYNHNGTDFALYPFGWTLMDAGTVDVVAAAPGTLLVAIDGRPDRSCSLSAPDTPNVVVLRHDDGRFARYLHMKAGSVTTREPGARIEAGETLGKVGSSGISTGPHLHFELREADDRTIVDPFAGSCNARESMWGLQRPYYDSRLNRVATHRAPPVSPGCPSTSDTPNFADEFARGATVHVGLFMRDVLHGQTVRMRVLKPDGTVQREGSTTSSTALGLPPHAPAVFVVFSTVLAADAPAGRWTAEATFEGETLRHVFTVTPAATCTAPTVSLAGPARGTAGSALSFTASVGGGPAQLDWDVEGDGSFDRTQFGVAASQSLAATYPEGGPVEVRVRATNAAGCSAEARLTVAIDAPDVRASASAPVQVCGDGDAAIEPGERWQVPVALRNEGTAFTRGAAVFARGVENKAALSLLVPAVPIDALAAGATANAMASFAVSPDAECGRRIALDYIGAVDERSHDLDTVRVLDATLGAGGACDATASACDAGIGEAFVPRDGLYSSFVRFGNGIASFAIPAPGGTIFGGQWFTGRRDRTPEWLIVQGPLDGKQATAPVLRFRQTGASPFAASGEVVGEARISYLSPTEYIATWTVDGVAAGEKLTLLYGTNRPEPNRTGSWFAPTESGWGEAIDDHILPNGASEQVIVNYYYDRAGRAVWTLGGGAVAGGEMAHNAFFVHCPSCAALPGFAAQSKPAGTTTTSFEGVLRGSYTTRIDLPAPLDGSWRRDGLRIELISEPQ